MQCNQLDALLAQSNHNNLCLAWSWACMRLGRQACEGHLGGTGGSLRGIPLGGGGGTGAPGGFGFMMAICWSSASAAGNGTLGSRFGLDNGGGGGRGGGGGTGLVALDSLRCSASQRRTPRQQLDRGDDTISTQVQCFESCAMTKQLLQNSFCRITVWFTIKLIMPLLGP